MFDKDRIMKNFTWIAIFFTLGYATPIHQVGGKQRIFQRIFSINPPREAKLDGITIRISIIVDFF